MKNTISHVCPHLGLSDDATTSLGFPSKSNYCHNSNPVSRPRLKHQEQFCLGGKYGQCPLFLSEQAIPLPEELKAPTHKASDNTKKTNQRNVAIAISAVVVILAVGWGILQSQQSTAITVAVIPTLPTPTAESLTTNTPVMTSTPALVSTPTNPAAAQRLDTIFGEENKFVVHKVVEGENLTQIASAFETSIDAILTINYIQTYPIWVGSILLVPVKSIDASKYPGIEQYLPAEQDRGISVDELAAKLQVDAQELRLYNGWTNSWDRPIVGEIVLVPRPRRESKHQLEMLIGTDYKFVIHKVLNGEGLEQLASKFDTNVEAIEIFNSYNNRTPGWSGTFLIIPVGFNDYSKLPNFKVYAVQESDRASSLDDLAKKLKVKPLELKYYNGFTLDGDRPLVGDYLLIPQTRIPQ